MSTKNFFSKYFLIAFLMMLLIGGQMFAQTQTVTVDVSKFGGSTLMELDNDVSVSATTNIWSFGFQIPEYDGLDSIRVDYEVLMSSDTAYADIDVSIFGYYAFGDTTWSVKAITGIADSTHSYQKGTVYLTGKYPYYCVLLDGATNYSPAAAVESF